MESCRQEEEGSQTCRLQGLFNLQCRSCNEYSHHTLLCSQAYQTDQTENEVNFLNSQHSSFSPPYNSSITSQEPDPCQCPTFCANHQISENNQQVNQSVQSQGQLYNYQNLPDQQANNIHFLTPADPEKLRNDFNIPTEAVVKYIRSGQ